MYTHVKNPHSTINNKSNHLRETATHHLLPNQEELVKNLNPEEKTELKIQVIIY